MPRGARLALFGIPVICSLVITTLSTLALALLLDKFPKFGVESTRDLGFMSYPGESTPRYWVIESIPFATAVFVKSANDEVRISGVRPEPLAAQMERLPQWSVAKAPWGGHFQIGESSKAPETSFIEIAIGFPFRSLLLRVRGQVRESSDSGELGKIGPEREPGFFLRAQTAWESMNRSSTVSTTEMHRKQVTSTAPSRTGCSQRTSFGPAWPATSFSSPPFAAARGGS